MWYDLVVIGGGINGCGCAADAAMRGLSVLLCEQADLASQTSSKSSQLIHGGLRYLEQYEFNLVRHALNEQQILLNIAPHLIHPLPFVLPYQVGLRPAWLLRCGLFLYDHLSRSNTLPHSKTLHKAKHPDYFAPLRSSIDKGFLLHDAQTHDARLTITVALQAQAHGATILPRTKFIQAIPRDKYWHIRLQSQSGAIQEVKAKAIINAAGSGIAPIAQDCHVPLRTAMTYVKGSHIVVPAFYVGNHAYILQAPDQRIIFVIPLQGQTLIGTTDVLITDPQITPNISHEEIDYLKQIVQQYFHHPITTILTTWSGIRALPAEPDSNPTDLSRDFSFEWHADPLPFITILSGKLTTYRCLAVQVLDQLQSIFPSMPTSTTERTPLPGGDWQGLSFYEYQRYAENHYSWLDNPILQHYLSTYGTRTDVLLADCEKTADLGQQFGPILRQKEIDFLIQTEWAMTAEDILWRRTRLGITIDDQDRIALENYLSQYSFTP